MLCFPWMQSHSYMQFTCLLGFPGSSDGKESAFKAGDLGSIPGSRGSPGEVNGNPLQCSPLRSSIEEPGGPQPMDREESDVTEWWFTFTFTCLSALIKVKFKCPFHMIQMKLQPIWYYVDTFFQTITTVPVHYSVNVTCLLRKLYAGQEATVRTGQGTTDWFQNRKRSTSRLYIVTLLI